MIEGKTCRVRSYRTWAYGKQGDLSLVSLINDRYTSSVLVLVDSTTLYKFYNINQETNPTINEIEDIVSKIEVRAEFNPNDVQVIDLILNKYTNLDLNNIYWMKKFRIEKFNHTKFFNAKYLDQQLKESVVPTGWKDMENKTICGCLVYVFMNEARKNNNLKLHNFELINYDKIDLE